MEFDGFSYTVTLQCDRIVTKYDQIFLSMTEKLTIFDRFSFALLSMDAFCVTVL
jgi:hypothetical protein